MRSRPTAEDVASTSPWTTNRSWELLPGGACRSDEHEVREGGVLEVLDWAENVKGDRTSALYVCSVDDSGPGLILLAGTDLTVT